jgi:hypothetical protein
MEKARSLAISLNVVGIGGLEPILPPVLTAQDGNCGTAQSSSTGEPSARAPVRPVTGMGRTRVRRFLRFRHPSDSSSLARLTNCSSSSLAWSGPGLTHPKIEAAALKA